MENHDLNPEHRTKVHFFKTNMTQIIHDRFHLSLLKTSHCCVFVCPLFYIQLRNIRSYGDIIIAIKGLQNLGLSLAPTPVEQ